MALTSKISDLAYEFDAERVLVMGHLGIAFTLSLRSFWLPNCHCVLVLSDEEPTHVKLENCNHSDRCF